MSDLEMWTIYDHPADYPDHYVARKWLIGSKRIEPEATDEVLLEIDLDVLRKRIPPWLYCMPRQSGDDPKIIEVWF
jgi:hypothetical protein